MSYKKIRSYKDLIVWKQGHKLVLEVYALTRTFPKEELYSLTDQMKRSAISITSNIAEGFSRKSSKEKSQFYYISLGSITELENQLLIAKDLRYLNNKDFKNLAEKLTSVHKLLNRLISTTRSKFVSP